MLASMTAYGRGECNGDWGSLICEISSLNHRYLEISLKLPQSWLAVKNALKTDIKSTIAEQIKRGKVECSIYYQPSQESNELVFNEVVLEQLAKAAKVMTDRIELPVSLNLNGLLHWPQLIQEDNIDLLGLRTHIDYVLGEALEQAVLSRTREGEGIATVIQQHCDKTRQIVTELKAKLPTIVKDYSEKLQARVAILTVEIDPERLELELAFLVQKYDITEEIDRLMIHIDEILRVLKAGSPAGRRLDFLAQELHREANTLGAKSIHSTTSEAAVELKVLIEQIREQIQNIE